VAGVVKLVLSADLVIE